MATAHAVVAGGGIGGLAVAGGLTRVGWRVTVLERRPGFTAAGAGITLEPNAVKALHALGTGARLSASAGVQGSLELRTAAGRRLIRSSAVLLRERYGVPAYALRRADLLRILRDAAHGADLRGAHRVTAVRQDGRQVAIGFRGPDGEQGELRADVLIAADGIRSTIRSALYPRHPGPRYAGYVTWRGVVDATAVAGAGLPTALTESWGRGHRFGIVPLADGRIYWFACAAGPAGTGVGADLAAVASRFAGWHDPIPRLLAASQPQTLLRHDIHHLAEPLPSYVHGSVALLGDAAHALTPDLGQGAAQALEDAVVLAASLGDRPHDVPRALADYDAARRGRTQRLVRASAQVARIAFWNPPAALVRDLLIGLVPAAAFLHTSDEAFGWKPPTLSSHGATE